MIPGFVRVFFFSVLIASISLANHELALKLLATSISDQDFQGFTLNENRNKQATSFSFRDGHPIYGHGITIELIDPDLRVIGFAFIKVTPQGVRIAQLQTKIAKGMGVGTNLVAKVALLAHKLGFSKISLTSTEEALEFYKRLGFEGDFLSILGIFQISLDFSSLTFQKRISLLGFTLGCSDSDEL